MYLDHYHLKAKPFDLSPEPRFLWLGEKHKEALATLNYGILEDLGFLLLTGDVGVGKTALIHRLITNLDSSTIVAHITDPGLGILDFFKLLAVEFNIDSGCHSKGEFLIELEKFLHKAYSDHKKVLLIVDEAQRLSGKLLDQIRVLSNIELSDRKLINIFFVGQPEFIKLLMTDSSRAIRQRIAINYQINPLTESETGQYIEHRLKVAGATHKIFQPSAIREIFRFTDGFPRAINVICDHALLTGYASGVNSIDSTVIDECEQELNIRAGFKLSRTDFQKPTARKRTDTSQPAAPRSATPRSASMGYLIVIGLFMVIGALASYYLLWPAPRRTIKPATQAPSKNESIPTASFKENATQEKAALGDEIESADRLTASVTTPVKPVPDPIPNLSEVDDGVTVPGELGAESAVTAVLAAKPEPNVSPPPKKETVAQKASPSRNTNPGTDGQAAIPAAGAALEPAPSTDTSVVGSPVTAAGKAAAAVVAVMAAKPEAEPNPTPRNETVAQKAAPARITGTGIDGRTAVPAAKAATEAVPSTDSPAVENELTITPGGAGTGATVVAVAVPTASKAGSPANPVTPVGNAAGKSGTNALNTAGTQGVNAAKSESVATAPSSPPIGEESSKKASSGNRHAEKSSLPEPESPVNHSVPPIAAKVETQPQPAIEPIGSTAPSVKKPDNSSLENRLRLFLQKYCNTYAAKDLGEFTTFFVPDAVENGKPFISLLPKYRKNFDFIETIEYQIELQRFSYDDDNKIVTIEGNFFLKWLPPDRKWRENSGTISMNLKESGPSFLVQQLDYQGTRSK